CDLQIRRLEVAMDDASLMSGLEAVGHLPRELDGLVDRNGAARQPRREILSLDQLECEADDAVRFFEAVDCSDVRMIERGEDLRFAPESRDAFLVLREARRQHLDGGIAIQTLVARAEDFTHPARADGREDLVGADVHTGLESHW